MQQSGSYRIQLSYGCRPLDAGGILRLRVGSTTIDHQVNATSTADQFAGFDAGSVTLKTGAAKITAEVVSSPGEELMRLNKITLVRAAP